MNPYIPLIIILAAALLLFGTLLVCFFLTFYSPKRKPLSDGEYAFPDGRIYEPYHDKMRSWIDSIRKAPHENFEIKSHDGLTLRATYYEYKPDAIIEIIFHGYKGNAERDLCAAVERCAALGRSVMLVDQRASGNSDGHIISFGVNERLDAVRWAEFAVKHFGPDVSIVLGGVSMGAATVLLAGGEALPPEVVCIMADCGYSSARDIIKKVIAEMKLPVGIFYPLVRLSGIIFGGFDIETASPREALSRCTRPVVFIHGDNDRFVPHTMSEEMYAVCPTNKKIKLISGAGHGLAYPVDPDGYVGALADFEAECGGFKLKSRENEGKAK